MEGGGGGRISEETGARGKIKTRGFALHSVKMVSRCARTPWLVHPAHLKLPEAGFEMVLSLLESCIFFLRFFYFSSCLKFCWYLQFEVGRVNLGLSPMEETMEAAVCTLFKMYHQSAIVFTSSWAWENVDAPAVSAILVQHILTMASALGFWDFS